MTDEKCNHAESKGTLRDRLLGHWVQTVPEDSAICEFDCSKTECSNSEWQHCKRRLDSLKHDEPPEG